MKTAIGALAGALFAFSSPVFAQEAVSTEATQPIWADIAFGMSRQAVEVAHPRGKGTEYNGDGSIEISDVTIIGKCDAEVNIYFEGGVVSKVMIAGNPSMGGRCSDTVLSGLASKYGQPLSKEESHGSILAREGKIFIWNRPGGVTMRFKKFSNGMFGGGGLAKASWELTYTNVGSDLAL